MILSDVDIRRLCQGDEPLISPFSEAVSGGGVISWGLSSAGYDIRLGDRMKVMTAGRLAMNPKAFDDGPYDDQVFRIERPREGKFLMGPNSYALGYSVERFCIPRHICAVALGKSTYARCGLIVNVTPGEPEWAGHLTLEFFNGAPRPLMLFVNEGCLQLQFHVLSSPCERSYADKNGKYQDQRAEPVSAKVE